MITLKKIAMLAVIGAFLVVPAMASASPTTSPTTHGFGLALGNATYQAGGKAVPFLFAFDLRTHQFTFQRYDGGFVATVTNYTRVGNEAAFSGQITQATGIFKTQVGQWAYFGVREGTGTTQNAIQVVIGSQYASSAPISPIYPYPVLGDIDIG